jgi:hypothetical protein
MLAAKSVPLTEGDIPMDINPRLSRHRLAIAGLKGLKCAREHFIQVLLRRDSAVKER